MSESNKTSISSGVITELEVEQSSNDYYNTIYLSLVGLCRSLGFIVRVWCIQSKALHTMVLHTVWKLSRCGAAFYTTQFGHGDFPPEVVLVLLTKSLSVSRLSSGCNFLQPTLATCFLSNQEIYNRQSPFSSVTTGPPFSVG